MKYGFIKRVGDGNNIRFWLDRWGELGSFKEEFFRFFNISC